MSKKVTNAALNLQVNTLGASLAQANMQLERERAAHQAQLCSAVVELWREKKERAAIEESVWQMKLAEAKDAVRRLGGNK